MEKLEGDPGCPCLIASRVYDDAKPVYYLSMISNKVKWIVKRSGWCIMLRRSRKR